VSDGYTKPSVCHTAISGWQPTFCEFNYVTSLHFRGLNAASEVTTLWQHRNVCIIIIIISK